MDVKMRERSRAARESMEYHICIELKKVKRSKPSNET